MKSDDICCSSRVCVTCVLIEDLSLCGAAACIENYKLIIIIKKRHTIPYVREKYPHLEKASM